MIEHLTFTYARSWWYGILTWYVSNLLAVCGNNTLIACYKGNGLYVRL
jgi:hypothetical protein